MTEIKKYANHCGWTDVNPFEVVKVISEQTVEIKAMQAEKDESVKMDFVVGGFSGICVNQNEHIWIITSNPNAKPFRIRYSKRLKRWRDAGGATYRMSDNPIKYYDYNF